MKVLTWGSNTAEFYCLNWQIFFWHSLHGQAFTNTHIQYISIQRSITDLSEITAKNTCNTSNNRLNVSVVIRLTLYMIKKCFHSQKPNHELGNLFMTHSYLQRLTSSVFGDWVWEIQNSHRELYLIIKIINKVGASFLLKYEKHLISNSVYLWWEKRLCNSCISQTKVK